MKSSKNVRRKRSELRLVDANINRFLEGARVVEDICRFILDAPRLTRGWKRVRHQLRHCVAAWPQASALLLLAHRETPRDVGRGSTAAELHRATIADIFLANAQRIKESLRVLEEFAKLYDAEVAKRIKALRYHVYALEKSSLEKVSVL